MFETSSLSAVVQSSQRGGKPPCRASTLVEGSARSDNQNGSANAWVDRRLTTSVLARWPFLFFLPFLWKQAQLRYASAGFYSRRAKIKLPPSKSPVSVVSFANGRLANRYPNAMEFAPLPGHLSIHLMARIGFARIDRWRHLWKWRQKSGNIINSVNRNRCRYSWLNGEELWGRDYGRKLIFQNAWLCALTLIHFWIILIWVVLIRENNIISLHIFLDFSYSRKQYKDNTIIGDWIWIWSILTITPYW